MPRELWAKVATEMKDDPKLIGRPESDRWLWLGLILLAKEKCEDGILRGYTPALLKNVLSLTSPPRKVKDALDYFAAVEPPMVRLHTDGAIELVNFKKRQAKSKDTPEAMRERQQRRRQKLKGDCPVTRDPPVTPPVTPVTCHAEEEEEEEEDPDRKKEETKVPSIQPNGDQQRPHQSWDPKLLATLKTALGKTDLDHDWQQFVGASLRYPNARREAAVREFLERGYAEDGKGHSYLLVMIRDGAGQRREHKPDVPAASVTGRVMPNGEQTKAALAALDTPRPTAEELERVKGLVASSLQAMAQRPRAKT